jgi:hypothetical protein
MTNLKLTLAILGICFLSTSCVSVKEYQKMYLNDADMVLADKDIELFEQGFLTYREGSSGGNGGKTGGGCGCN